MKKSCCDFHRESVESIDQFYENWQYNIESSVNLVYPFVYLDFLNLFKLYFVVFSVEVLCFLSDLFPDIWWVLSLVISF